jgi:hypothetical protein
MQASSFSENSIRKKDGFLIDSVFNNFLLPDPNRLEIMKGFQSYTRFFLKTKYLKLAVVFIFSFSIYSLHLIYKNVLVLDNQSAKVLETIILFY